MSKAVARLISERKFRDFLDALVDKENISVSDIESTGSGEHRVFVLGQSVIIPIKHHGETGIKAPYLGRVIDAAALKYGQPGTLQYASGKKRLKNLARQVIGF
ncbi:MAG TPA: hypothetical protein HA362_07970 [Nanoarchaeota archaeon]|nr:hypothetical protein [Nanoarchaeota archaeon]